LILTGFAVCQFDVAHTTQLPAGIERLAWLHGCWELTSPSRTVEEHWMPPRGNTMIGVGRTVDAAGNLVEYELVVVRQAEDHLIYEAHPSGQPAAQFSSVEMSASRIVFENLTHDFHSASVTSGEAIRCGRGSKGCATAR
jgi:hypothetical protein